MRRCGDSRRFWKRAARTSTSSISTPDPAVPRLGSTTSSPPAARWPSLLARAEDALRPLPREDADEAGPYLATPAGFVYRKDTQNGPVDQPLSNFTARIVEEVIADDGASERVELVIEGELGEQPLPRIRVPTRRFALARLGQWRMGSAPHHRGRLRQSGPGARGDPAPLPRHRAPARLRTFRLAQPARARLVLPPCGWGHRRCRRDRRRGRGAARARRVASCFPIRRAGTTCARPYVPACRCSTWRRIAITVPLFGAVYRALLCELVPADTSVFLVGPTGVFKSELAALAMQHVGAGFDRLHLPAHWSATANFLERVAFDFKDAPLVIDDFAPSGTQTDVARLHATADRVLRGVGNRGGRGRMQADGTLRPDFPPRGIVIGTGEDAPRGQSLRSRMVILDVAPGDVDRGAPDRRPGSRQRRACSRPDWPDSSSGLAPQFDALRDATPAAPDRLPRAGAPRRGACAHPGGRRASGSWLVGVPALRR